MSLKKGHKKKLINITFMDNNFNLIPIRWFYKNESDEQPIGVLVQVDNGDTQYLTTQEYNTLLKNKNNQNDLQKR